MGHLLSHEAHLVGLLRGGGGGGSVLRALGVLGRLGPPGDLPGAVKGLANDGVVGLLGDGALAALMEGGEVVLHKAHHAILGAVAVGDSHKQVRVRHEVSVHFQQRALFQDEGGQDHLRRKKRDSSDIR